MFARSLPRFTHANGGICGSSFHERFNTTLFNNRVRIQDEDKFRRGECGKQVYAASKAVIVQGPQDMALERGGFELFQQNRKCPVPRGIIEKVANDRKLYAPQTLDQGGDEAFGVVQDNKDVDLR